MVLWKHKVVFDGLGISRPGNEQVKTRASARVFKPFKPPDQVCGGRLS